MREAALGRVFSEETRRKLSKAITGKILGPYSEERKRKMVEGRMRRGGYRVSEETRRKLSETLKRTALRGPDNPAWKGGVSFEPYSLGFNNELKLWVRTGDNFTCQKCGRLEAEEKVEFGQVLSVHHIDHNKKNCKEDNLITLCLRCNSEVNDDPEHWQVFFTQLTGSRDFCRGNQDESKRLRRF